MIETAAPAQRNLIGLAVLGLLVGLASGLFGVGGGIIIVPGLVYLFGYPQKLAAGTSLLAIVLPALSGVVSYGVNGRVDYLLALLLAAGSVLGAPIGARMLKRLPVRAVQWAFILFLGVVIVSLFLVVPARDAQVELDLLRGTASVAIGFVVGIIGGLVGIGGGVVAVPAIVLLLGGSDLVAKGTSLLMIIATGLSGTIANLRNRNVDPVAAAVIGVVAAAVAPLSVFLAGLLTPFWANVAFVAFLALVIVRMLVDVFRRPSLKR